MRARSSEDRPTERLNFRARPQVKDAIRRAARLSGLDDSAFALGAAYRAALDTIERHERTSIAPRDQEAFFSALDNPPEPTGPLGAAVKRRRELFGDS